MLLYNDEQLLKIMDSCTITEQEIYYTDCIIYFSMFTLNMSFIGVEEWISISLKNNKTRISFLSLHFEVIDQIDIDVNKKTFSLINAKNKIVFSAQTKPNFFCRIVI